jgi:fructokinase
MNPIVGIGEVLWDVYPDGRKVAGGAPFNFAFHCHQLGHDAVIVSRVGDDELGRALRARVCELGLSDEYIQTDPNHPTGTVQVKLDANAVPTYAITENVAWDYIAWDAKLEDLAGRYEAVCFGTLARRTMKKVADDPIFRFLMTPHRHHPAEDFDPLAKWSPRTDKRKARPLVVADLNLRPPFVNEDAVMRATIDPNWFKLNFDEMRALWPKLMPVEGREEFTPRNWLERLFWEGGPPDITMIATDGPNGVTVVHRDYEFHEHGVLAKVVDTVGAGDAFTAAMVCLHLEGKSLHECARFANHYAARVCEQPGGTPRISRAEVERAAGLSP